MNLTASEILVLFICLIFFGGAALVSIHSRKQSDRDENEK